MKMKTAVQVDAVERGYVELVMIPAMVNSVGMTIVERSVASVTVHLLQHVMGQTERYSNHQGFVQGIHVAMNMICIHVSMDA